MRGTEVTPAQMNSAREFLSSRVRNTRHNRPESDAQVVSLTYGDLARLVAWYGALRYKAGADGTGGTLEAPGTIDFVQQV